VWEDLRYFKDSTHEAVRCFEQIIEINPSNAKAWFGKGACLLEMGRPREDSTKVREAIACFKKSLSIDPNNQAVARALRMCEGN
jgi:tetratricopeptide (TPR) repeat protein